MITATYVNATTFEVSGDQTAEFHVGRRVKLIGDTTKYGTILSVSIPVADTQVVLTAASDNLDASLTGVYYGIVGKNNSSIPEHDHDGDEGSGGETTPSHTDTTLSGTPIILEKKIGGTVYYSKWYPIKA
jgi:hypothetical protein